jgi:hypothetical protein
VKKNTQANGAGKPAKTIIKTRIGGNWAFVPENAERAKRPGRIQTGRMSWAFDY